jgi:hypothetical protein
MDLKKANMPQHCLHVSKKNNKQSRFSRNEKERKMKIIMPNIGTREYKGYVTQNMAGLSSIYYYYLSKTICALQKSLWLI